MKDATTSFLTAGLLSIALTTAGAPAATAHDDDRRSHRSWTVTVDEETELAAGLVGPLRVAVGRGNTAYVSQNFSGQLTAFDRGDEPVTLVGKPGIEIGGVSTDNGRIYFTESVGGPGVDAPPVANLNVYKRGEVSLLADLNEYEKNNDPDKGAAYGLQNVDDGCLALVPEALAPSARPHGGEEYSHPYATAPARHEIYVADAGANAILAVNEYSGAVRTVAVLPPVPTEITQAVLDSLKGPDPANPAPTLPECTRGKTFNSEPVPTDIEIGDDGFLYVTSLPGVPEAPGSGSVLQINPWTGDIKKVAAGFTGATGLAIDKRGNIFVAELFANRISIIKAGSGEPELFLETMMPADVEIDGKDLYATTNALPSEDPAVPPNGTLIKYELEYDRNR